MKKGKNSYAISNKYIDLMKSIQKFSQYTIRKSPQHHVSIVFGSYNLTIFLKFKIH